MKKKLVLAGVLSMGVVGIHAMDREQSPRCVVMMPAVVQLPSSRRGIQSTMPGVEVRRMSFHQQTAGATLLQRLKKAHQGKPAFHSGAGLMRNHGDESQ